jgi:hypothetical protein
LEGEKYVTASLVIPMIHDLRLGLVEAGQRDVNRGAHDPNSVSRHSLLVHMHASFLKRWGDGTNICVEREGPRGQPRGFAPEQVIATFCDPRTKNLKGIPVGEHDNVFALVEKFLIPYVERARAKQAMINAPVEQGIAQPGDADYNSDDAQAAELAQQNTPRWLQHNVTPQQAARLLIKMYNDQHRLPDGSLGAISFNDSAGNARNPLQWWKIREKKYGPLAELARVALAAPATSAPVERVFSDASQKVPKRRDRVSADHLETVVFLSNVWTEVRQNQVLTV